MPELTGINLLEQRDSLMSEPEYRGRCKSQGSREKEAKIEERGKRGREGVEVGWVGEVEN